MSIVRIKDVVDCELEGRTRYYGFNKTPTVATIASIWFDISMSGGNPRPKYWFDATPMVAQVVRQSTDGGIYHGANVSPSAMYLRQIGGVCANLVSAINVTLLDYLLYYPSIDEGTTDVQVMDNTNTLTRYTDGKGVQILPVIVGASSSTAQFFVTYTNSDGVAGRTSATVALNTGPLGTIAASSSITGNATNPFIPLQHGDSGVRSIESVTMLSTTDGLFSLILVAPICNFIFQNKVLWSERDLILSQNQMPKIYDDAFLSYVCLCNSTMNGYTFKGEIKVIWD